MSQLISTLANMNWGVTRDSAGNWSWDTAKLAVLCDIRRELQQLNRLLGCARFIGIPDQLQQIELNTTRKKRKRKKRAVSK